MDKDERTKSGKIWLEKEARPYRRAIFALTVLSVLVTSFTLAFAYLVRYLINSASDGDKKLLWIFAAVLLGVLLLKISLKTFEGFYAELIRARMYANLRAKTFSKILRSDYGYLQSYHSGDLQNRLTTDVQEVCIDTVGLTPKICEMIVQCLGAIAALLTIDAIFTAIYVVCGVLLGGLTALFRRQIKKRHKDVLSAEGEVRSFMQEGLSSVMTIKAYNAETGTSEKAQALSDAYYQKRLKRNVLRTEMNFIFSLLSNFGLIFAVVWCSVSVLRGNDDYGSILSVILLLMQLQQPLTSVSSVIPVYYSRMASAERLAELEMLPEEVATVNEQKGKRLYENTTAIVVDGLGFSYDRDAVFSGAETRINKGEIVCLTGPSGAGKSTIFKLLLSVFSPKEGRIYLQGAFDGKEEMPLSVETRALFAYVPQGNFLFSGTIYENLTFFLQKEGKEVDEARINDALRVACAEFVFRLPNGLQTQLMEGGEGLSEGQLQRLNVARAILSNRPVLLLDEATSALDGATEKKLLENIRALQGKTCLIVTHRPAAIAIADRVLSIENGKISDVR